MRSSTTLLLIAGLTSVYSAELCAQTPDVVIPAAARVSDGNHVSDAPFVYDHFRAQQTWDAKSVAASSASITSMAWRRDTGNNTAYAPGGRLLQNFRLALGYSTVSPDQMSRTFNANVTGGLTQVFQGPLNLPPQPPAIVQAQWSVVVPFTAPFSYVPVQGHLLADWEEPGPASKKDLYPLDAQYWGKAGRVSTFGSGGKFTAQGLPLRVYYNSAATPSSSIVPGGAFELRIYQMPSAVPTVAVFGLSSVLSPLGPLPTDLSPFGATGNTLYCSLDGTSAPLTPVQGANGRFTVHLNLPIPNNTSLAGAQFFNQGVSLAPGANTLGAVFSNAQQVLIGGIIARPETNMIYSSDSSRPDGSFLYSNGAGGLVTLFQGTFQ